jgi:hypothetical protein
MPNFLAAADARDGSDETEKTWCVAAFSFEVRPDVAVLSIVETLSRRAGVRGMATTLHLSDIRARCVSCINIPTIVIFLSRSNRVNPPLHNKCRRLIFQTILVFLPLLAVHAPQAGEPGFDQALAAIQARRYTDAARILGPLAAAGHAPSQVELGLLRYHGRGVDESDQEAFSLFARAARQGNLDGMFHLGHLYALGSGIPSEESDADRKAAQWLFEAAVRGHPNAQHSLGILFLAGKGVVQNNDEGLKWITRAAEQGNPDARRFLGGYSGKP